MLVVGCAIVLADGLFPELLVLCALCDEDVVCDARCVPPMLWTDGLPDVRDQVGTVLPAETICKRYCAVAVSMNDQSAFKYVNQRYILNRFDPFLLTLLSSSLLCVVGEN